MAVTREMMEKWSDDKLQGFKKGGIVDPPIPPVDKFKILPTDAQERKDLPIGTGVLDYFPDALAAVAKVSFYGNQQHNPGQPLHWDKTKSTDHENCIIRHYLERGTFDVDGTLHSAKLAWRALALLQIEIEKSKVVGRTGTSMGISDAIFETKP